MEDGEYGIRVLVILGSFEEVEKDLFVIRNILTFAM